MNRLKEYEDLLQEIDSPVPALENTLERAQSKRVRRQRMVRPIASVAMAFVLFVVLVNFSTPVAYACSKVPVLRELAEAVTFSRSLSDAVDNEYVQSICLAQEDGEVSASIEYLIVDQKQVNVFFKLFSDTYENLAVYPTVLEADGEHFASCSYGLNEWDVPNGELQSLTIDFVEGDVPDSLRVKLGVQDMEIKHEAVEEAVPLENSEDFMFSDHTDEEIVYVAEFDFLLEFDPKFTATGKVLSINQTVLLEGQEITITQMEIYPTHLRVNIEDAAQNSAWLKDLDFYIETDWGMKFDTISEGITATGAVDSPTMTSFRADSSYFYEAKHLEIVITGAEWLKKDMEKVHINLQTGETGQLPEGVSFYDAELRSGGWLVKFKADYRKPNHHHQLFSNTYYDAEGNEFEINSWTSEFGKADENGEVTYFIEAFPLKGYTADEVWLRPHYSHVWTAREPVVVQVQ